MMLPEVTVLGRMSRLGITADTVQCDIHRSASSDRAPGVKVSSEHSFAMHVTSAEIVK